VRRLAIGALLIGLSGCSFGAGTIDHKKAEDLARKVAGAGGKAPLKSVSCPGGIKLKKGSTFDCSVVYANGAKATITLHQLDDNGRVETGVGDIRLQRK
jgi:hypothetical protein